MNKKIYIRTFGCQMNVRDSEVIAGILLKDGYKITDESNEADIVIFNTCSVRQHAEDKVWSDIGRFKNGKILGLVGCMAKNYQEKVFERAPNVDFVVGPSDIDKIPAIMKILISDKKGTVPFGDSPFFERKIWETDGVTRPEDIYHTGYYGDKERAYVVISEGCSNNCSYCVVPFVRGALRHRNYKDIIKEIKEAVDLGITKITLLGQNVNSYIYEEVNFIKLIELVNGIRGLKEFSFVTSHPKDTPLDLFKAMADQDKLKKYLHLPVQSGSDRILKLMNRDYSRKFYLDLAQSYRKMVKKDALTTDIIVGFPTETEEDFQDTYNLVNEVEFNAAFIFKYSLRPHTDAARMVDDVPKDEKERRHKLILDLQKEISNGKKNDLS